MWLPLKCMIQQQKVDQHRYATPVRAQPPLWAALGLPQLLFVAVCLHNSFKFNPVFRQVYLCSLPRKREGRFKAIEKLSHSLLKARVQHQRASRVMLSWKAPEKTYLRPSSGALGFSGSLYSPQTAILMTPLASPASLGPPLSMGVTVFSSDKGSSHTVRAQLHTFIRHDLFLFWFHLQNLLPSKGHSHS